MDGGALIGRRTQRAWLEDAVAEAVAGRGALVLLAGDAGIGKTRLAEEVCGRAPGATFLRGAALPAGAPYTPIVAALRRYLQRTPGGLASCGPLRRHLALLLPELGEAVDATDRATLLEAIRCGLATIAAQRPAVVLLDDLQWSDDATLELLGSLAAALRDLPVLVVAAYRSDEVPRPHPLRRLRTDLRRDRLLRELTLEPLSPSETAELVERVLGQPVAPALADRLYRRTQGVPFFVEEVASVLLAQGHLQPGPGGADIAGDDDVPLPETIRDAVLLRVAPLAPDARAAAEAAAVAGAAFDLETVAALGSADGLDALLASGLLVERGEGRASFRHPLVREAVYDDVPWHRRRTLHRELAELLEGRGEPRSEVAAHWLAAREPERALDALVEAVGELEAVHAYRDAARVSRQALELWPDGERSGERLALLDRHARSAELAGDAADAARALRELVAARETAAGRALAETQRRLAAVYELQGDREHALVARRHAAEAFAEDGLPAEAAAERLVAAAYLQAAAKHGAAIELAVLAGEEAERSGRVDLRARALGLAGVARAKRGEFDEGVATVRAGLALALEHGLTSEAAEVYQRLGTTLEVAADYVGAEAALETAVGLCRTDGAASLEHTCLGCVAYVVRELGDWQRAEEVCRDLLRQGGGAGRTLVADGVLGGILVFRGELGAARPLLVRCQQTAVRLDVVSMQVDTAACMAMADASEGAHESAAERCRFLLARWEGSEDHHYAVWGLRWAASYLARQGAVREARACADALATLAASCGYHDALAALAHALAELALARGRRSRRREPAGSGARPARDARHPVRAGPDPRPRGRRRRGARAARAGAGAAGGGPSRRAAARRSPARGGGGRRGRGPRRARRALARTPRLGRGGERRALAPRARGGAADRERPAQPRDRERALPQPAHRRHARAQHPRQARLPLPHGGGGAGARARAARRRARLGRLGRRPLRGQLRRLDVLEAVHAPQRREAPRPDDRHDDRADAADDDGGHGADERGEHAGLERAELVGGADEGALHGADAAAQGGRREAAGRGLRGCRR